MGLDVSSLFSKQYKENWSLDKRVRVRVSTLILILDLCVTDSLSDIRQPEDRHTLVTYMAFI